MDCGRSNFKVLIVDHDDASLRYLANILMEWQCIVKIAKNAQEALLTLQANYGFYDLIITEFHLLGMNGFDFQKHIQDQFEIPMIMMSKDSRQHLISRILKNGAAHFIVKPFCAEDFKNIWKYVIDARKHKLCRKRNNTGEYLQGDEEYQVDKKPRVVWTTYLHNLFLLAIEQIGFEKAKPKKILEIMNVPNLTKENVASHLQKYQKFQRKVANKGMVGGISNRAFGSIFASDVPTSTVKEIKEMRATKCCKPTMEHSQTLSCQMGLDSNVLNFDGASTSFFSYRGEERSNVLNFDCASNNEVEFNQMKFNLCNFLMADDMNLMNEMNVNHDASELKSYMFNFFQDVLPLEQLNKGCDDVSPSAKITSCVWNESPKSSSQNSNQLNKGCDDVSPSAEITTYVWNESPKSSSQNSNHLYNGDNNVVSPLSGITTCVLREPPNSNQISIQLQGNERFSNGEASKASTSAATNPEFDMDLIEARFN